MESELVSKETIIAFKNGEQNAFKIIYMAYSKAIYQHLIRLTKNQVMADEMLQETFLLSINKSAFFNLRENPEREFRAWLYRLATNLVIDYFRKEKSKNKYKTDQQFNSINLTETSLEQMLIEDETKNEVILQIRRLPKSQQILISLKIFQGLSNIEISRICGLNINAVKQGLFRARAGLKKRMQLNMEEIR